MDERRVELERQRTERMAMVTTLSRLRFGLITLEHFNYLEQFDPNPQLTAGKEEVGMNMLSMLPQVVTHVDMGDMTVSRDSRYLDLIPEEQRVMWTLDDVRGHIVRLQQQLNQQRPQFPPLRSRRPL